MNARELFDMRVRELADATALRDERARELEQARGACDAAQREVDAAKAEHLGKPSVGTARRIAAESALRVAEMSLEACEAQRELAHQLVIRARHTRDLAEFQINEEQRAAIRAGLAENIRRLVGLAREATNAVDGLATAVDEHQELEDRAEQLATSLGRYDIVQPLGLGTLRVACGIAVERELGLADLPDGELGETRELSRAIGRLKKAARKSSARDFASEFEHVLALVTTMLGGDSADWMRPALAPQPDDDDGAYTRTYTDALALLDEIGMPAREEDHEDERLSLGAGSEPRPSASTEFGFAVAAASSASTEAP